MPCCSWKRRTGSPGGFLWSPAARAVLEALPHVPGRPYVFTNAATEDRYTVNGALHVFRRAVHRAGIRTGDFNLHTLRHTAISRMIAKGHNDHVVMAISGHSSTRMLERYTHPTDERKLEAVDTFTVGTKWDIRRIGRMTHSLNCANC